MQLVLGAGRVDRRLDNVETLLLAYRVDSGSEYLDHRPASPSDALVVEDLAVTTFINSRFSMEAARSIACHGREINLAALPDVGLEEATSDQRAVVAALVAEVASWPGIAASVATKVLHKKRPGLIPILDNQAIFGAYMNPRWPERPSLAESVRGKARIEEALDWIWFDLTRPENAEVWPLLHEIEPTRSRIQLFDSIWWIHFREIEPLRRYAPVENETERGESPAPVAVTSPPRDTMSDKAVVFENDESGYLAWLERNPGGYVLNCHPKPKASYLMLHRASCRRINGSPPRGTTWTTPYIKVCAESRGLIEAWALTTTGGEVSSCGWCSSSQEPSSLTANERPPTIR